MNLNIFHRLDTTMYHEGEILNKCLFSQAQICMQKLVNVNASNMNNVKWTFNNIQIGNTLQQLSFEY